jgi:hypothetical protein
MPSLYLELATTLVQGVLMVVFGYLTRRGWITAEQAGQLSAHLVLPIVGVLGGLCTLAWMAWERLIAKRRQLVAQIMPAHSTEAAVNFHIASGQPVPSVLTPPTMIPIPLSSLL